MRIIACRMDKFPTNFGVARMFRSRLIGQHLSDASRDITTLTFDLGVHGACSWRGSSCSVRVLSLNFVGLLVRKILRIYCESINRPFDLWPWNWFAISPVRKTTFLPILVFLWCFVFDISAKNLSTRHVTFRPLPLTLEVTALVADADLRPPYAYQVWSS